MPASRPSRDCRTSYFSSADSFGMIRGGHIQLSILGGMQVSQTGDLANWRVPGKMIKGIGVPWTSSPAYRAWLVMDHCEKGGDAKLKRQCSLPLTGKGVVDLLITELGVFEIDRKGYGATLVELDPGVTVDEVHIKTEAPFSERLAC